MERDTDEFLWTERYRPRRVADVILAAELKAAFQAYVDAKNIPNLLLVGPSGTGKTTVAKAMCAELGSDCYVINSSLKGNIDTLRVDIADFASSVSFSGGRKYVVLDEADHLNPNSTQPALRGFIEAHTKNCGFILTCNYGERIIPAIRSRLTTINFKPPQGTERASMAGAFFGRCLEILTTEGVKYEQSVVAQVINKHFPDWRKVLEDLQDRSMRGAIDLGSLAVDKTTDLDDLVRLLKDKNYTGVRKWLGECNDLDGIFSSLYRAADKYVADSPSTAQLAFILAKYQHYAGTAADPELNLAGCMAEIMIDVSWK